MHVATDPHMDDTVLERDDLDVIFEDIAAMVLPKRYVSLYLLKYDCMVINLLIRYDDEIADFAQNLGFLTNELNFDSMAFHGAQEAP